MDRRRGCRGMAGDGLSLTRRGSSGLPDAAGICRQSGPIGPGNLSRGVCVPPGLWAGRADPAAAGIPAAACNGCRSAACLHAGATAPAGMVPAGMVPGIMAPGMVPPIGGTVSVGAVPARHGIGTAWCRQWPAWHGAVDRRHGIAGRSGGGGCRRWPAGMVLRIRSTGRPRSRPAGTVPPERCLVWCRQWAARYTEARYGAA